MNRHLIANVLRACARACAACADRVEQPAQRVREPAPSREVLALQRQAAWVLSYQSFLVVGELVGFSIRAMQRAGVTRETREAYVVNLCAAGVLVEYPRRGTFYGLRADGRPWHAQAVRAALQRGQLELPCPADADPLPLWPVAAAQQAQRSLAAHSRRRLEPPC